MNLYEALEKDYPGRFYEDQKEFGCSLYPHNKTNLLPVSMTVLGDLNLENTRVDKLPEFLIVSGTLDIRGTKIRTLSNVIKVGRGLQASHSKLTSLPDNLHVAYLDISSTDVEELPVGLVVDGYVDVTNTRITSIPNDSLIGGRIYSKKPLDKPKKIDYNYSMIGYKVI